MSSFDRLAILRPAQKAKHHCITHTWMHLRRRQRLTDPAESLKLPSEPDDEDDQFASPMIAAVCDGQDDEEDAGLSRRCLRKIDCRQA